MAHPGHDDHSAAPHEPGSKPEQDEGDDLAMAVPDVPGPKPQQDVDLEKGLPEDEHRSHQEADKGSGEAVQHGGAVEGGGVAKTLNLSQVDASTLADFEVRGHVHTAWWSVRFWTEAGTAPALMSRAWAREKRHRYKYPSSTSTTVC